MDTNPLSHIPFEIFDYGKMAMMHGNDFDSYKDNNDYDNNEMFVTPS